MRQSSDILRSSRGSNSRASLSSTNPNPILIICGEHDATENLHVAGAFHTPKSKLNTEHFMEVTNN